MNKNDTQPKIYLVGGAVRDRLLGLPIKERDWVVIGSTPEKMIAQGFQPVGKDFPVFLHPNTHEEYALARTERKTAKGYKGFVFHTDPNITLEEDLKRRDLTINAIAQDHNDTLIDPYHGQQDIKNKLLKHVSPAFAEDPVRILRVARFAAKLPDFQVDETTNQLMQQMVENGEVDALVAERVWQELKTALSEKKPSRFFEVLSQCQALPRLFPELTENAYDIDHDNYSPQQRFALLCIALSDHEINQLCQRYRIASDFSDLAKQVRCLLPLYKKLDFNNSNDILHFIMRADAQRRPERFDSILHVLSMIGKLDHTDLLKTCIDALKNIDTTELQQKNLKGHAFADALECIKQDIITAVIQSRRF